MTIIIFWCGIAHILLTLASLIIPRVLNWKEGLKHLQPLLRQMFWTYAGYILAINFSFGLVSILGAADLLDQSFLAKSLTLFIALYWFARVLIQFFYFDRTDAPKGWFFTLGEIGASVRHPKATRARKGLRPDTGCRPVCDWGGKKRA